mmetsp:Transcript_32023/g.58982  ORF Transcript_32023/g.58982 Transcript_32023/m.58982 type:complete len:297 (+) Transcript_32023:651-1541(+)
MPQRVSRGLEVYEQHSVHPTLERKRPAVQDRMTLEQQHVSRLQCHVVCDAVVIVNLAGPGLVDVLGHVDHGGRHERKTIDVRKEDGALGVHANAVHGRGRQVLAGPVLERLLGRVPDRLLELPPRTAQTLVVDADHVRGGGPVVRVRVARRPLLLLAVEMILVPEVPGDLDDLVGSSRLEESHLRVILHGLRLTIVHQDPIVLVNVALRALTRRLVRLSTTLEVRRVHRLPVSEDLEGHVLIEGRDVVACVRVVPLVVRQPGVVDRRPAVDGEGDVHPVVQTRVDLVFSGSGGAGG